MEFAVRILKAYYLAQAALITAWWLLLFSRPEWQTYFQPNAWPNEVLQSFFAPDMAMLVGGSLLAAAAIHFQRSWASIAVWALAAVAWYPTLYCIATSVMTGEAWIASGLMTSLSGLSLAMATIHGTASQSPATFRTVRISKGSAVAWTAGQIVIFWCTFLWILPMGICELERAVCLEHFAHWGQSVIAGAVFIPAALLGLWSAWNMAYMAGATPLPTAAPGQLIVSGPYNYLRNPMACAGIVQGIAVGWYLGSVAVILYAILGAFVWHIIVRPVEENDLQQRFGDAYMAYRRSVGLWLPNILHSHRTD